MIEFGLPRLIGDGRDPAPIFGFVVISQDFKVVAAFADEYEAKALAQEKSHETKTDFVVRPGLIAPGSPAR